MNTLKILLSIIFFSVFLTSYSQEYYCVNGYGKISLLNDGEFYFDYFDVGNDTGSYIIKGDTLFLTSSIQPVEFFACDNKYFTDTSSLLDIGVKVYAKNGFVLKDNKFILHHGELLKDINLKIDTSAKIFVEKMLFSEGQLISFDFFGGYRFLVPEDTVLTGYFYIDVYAEGRRVYFRNYPLLIIDDFLLPFERNANEYFRKINGFEFLPMKKGKENQKYKTYMSGFGSVY